MKTIQSIPEMKEFIQEERKLCHTIGFVPTMGFLHDGHLSLIRRSIKENETNVLSIFLNPTQFAPGEDLSIYPQDLERDSRLARESGIQVLFCPNKDELYPKNYQTYVSLDHLSQNLCGKNRPDHFRGVATIVSKLFNIVRPDRAYFGQKDAQQYYILSRMARDLNYDIDVIMCPIVRELNGLAMSSRNVYLNPEERRQAESLHQALKIAKKMIAAGERNSQKIKSTILEIIDRNPLAIIDYIETVRTKTLEPVEELKGPILIALAVVFGKTRLLDNIIIDA